MMPSINTPAHRMLTAVSIALAISCAYSGDALAVEKAEKNELPSICRRGPDENYDGARGMKGMTGYSHWLVRASDRLESLWAPHVALFDACAASKDCSCRVKISESEVRLICGAGWLGEMASVAIDADSIRKAAFVVEKNEEGYALVDSCLRAVTPSWVDERGYQSTELSAVADARVRDARNRRRVDEAKKRVGGLLEK